MNALTVTVDPGTVLPGEDATGGEDTPGDDTNGGTTQPGDDTNGEGGETPATE